MSEPQTQIPTPVEEITPELIKQLIERASPIENKYLLILSEYSRHPFLGDPDV